MRPYTFQHFTMPYWYMWKQRFNPYLYWYQKHYQNLLYQNYYNNKQLMFNPNYSIFTPTHKCSNYIQQHEKLLNQKQDFYFSQSPHTPPKKIFQNNHSYQHKSKLSNKQTPINKILNHIKLQSLLSGLMNGTTIKISDFIRNNVKESQNKTDLSEDSSDIERDQIDNKSQKTNFVNAISEISSDNSLSEIPIVNSKSESPIINAISEIPIVDTISEIPIVDTISEIPGVNSLSEIPIVNSTSESLIINAISEIPNDNSISEIPVINSISEISIQDCPLPEKEHNTSVSPESSSNKKKKKKYPLKKSKRNKLNKNTNDSNFVNSLSQTHNSQISDSSNYKHPRKFVVSQLVLSFMSEEFKEKYNNLSDFSDNEENNIINKDFPTFDSEGNKIQYKKFDPSIFESTQILA